jgi:hypothetical protein
MLKKNWIYLVITIGLLAFWWMRYKTVQDINISSIQIQTADQAPASRLSDVINKKTVVHYYASWCGPCMRELPQLIEFASSHSEYDILLITDDPWAKIQVVQQRLLSPNIHVYHTQSLKEIGIYSIPVSYFTNEKSEIVHSSLGETQWQNAGFLQELQQHY